MGNFSYPLRQLALQENIASNQVKMGRSDYFPMVALFGKQTLYSRHLPSSLVPRTWVGVGFVWNLFDGCRREAKVRRAFCLQRALKDAQEEAREKLEIGIDRLYAVLQCAKDKTSTLQLTLDWSRELLRIRRKSFLEGLATASEVLDAETSLAKLQVAYLAVYYEYDVALAALLSLCGMPDTFTTYVHAGQKWGRSENLNGSGCK